MPKWQCSRCWKKYTFEEFRLLPTCFVNIKEKEKYGKTCVCFCGAIFHKDKWHLVSWVDGYRVTTVHLELGSPDNENFLSFKTLHFETMINDDKGKWLSFQKRYATLDEAIAGHWFVVDKLPSIVMNPDMYPSGIIDKFTNLMGASIDQQETKFRKDNK